VISFAKRANDHEYDRGAYKRRNLIERWVNALKHFRRLPPLKDGGWKRLLAQNDVAGLLRNHFD
jgi:transposase